MKNCKCGEKLIFNDGSILSQNEKCCPLYFCPKCNKIWDGYDLDTAKWTEITIKKYRSWFTKESFRKIKEWHIIKREEEIKEYDSIIKRLTR